MTTKFKAPPQLTSKTLNLDHTLSCGQFFRFEEDNGVWTVKAGFNTLKVTQNDLSPIVDNPFWYNYFDLETDYEEMRARFSLVSPIMKEACDFSYGIRILRQDPWEALCSFVVSQNNNIKRIKGIVERMCNAFGAGGFPSAAKLAGVSEQALREIGLGFRAPYILAVSQAVASGSLNLEEIANMEIEQAREKLVEIKGIGPKVANCALLFGFHRLDCFPMDVWMKRVMATYFEGRDESIFGENAGVAQQYLFHWIRNKEQGK